MKIILFVCLLLLMTPLYAGSYDETRELNLSVSGIDKFKIECGSGFLKVKGDAGLDEIQVKAEILLEGIDEDEAKEILDRYLELSLEKRGSKAILLSSFHGQRGFFNRARNVHINLTVNVPKNLELIIDDGSGYIEIEDMEADISIEDGSGDLTISRVNGNLEIDDGSGDLGIYEVSGRTDIEDGSGSIEVRDLKGDLDIDDGSGSMHIELVDGSVEVSDGSGSITIRKVSEDVTIRDSGSGGVSIRDVEGTVRRYDDDD